MTTKIMAMYKMAQAEKSPWYAVGYGGPTERTITNIRQDHAAAMEEVGELKSRFERENSKDITHVYIRTINLTNEIVNEWLERGLVGMLDPGVLEVLKSRIISDEIDRTPSEIRGFTLEKPRVPDVMPDFDKLPPARQEQGLSNFDPSKIQEWNPEEYHKQKDWWHHDDDDGDLV